MVNDLERARVPWLFARLFLPLLLREQGTHADLLRAQGLYYRLHRLQYERPAVQPLLVAAAAE